MPRPSHDDGTVRGWSELGPHYFGYYWIVRFKLAKLPRNSEKAEIFPDFAFTNYLLSKKLNIKKMLKKIVKEKLKVNF